MSDYQKLQEAITTLAKYELSSPVWIHEAVLSRILPRIEGLCSFEIISKIDEYLKKGYFGNSRSPTKVTEGKVDLTQQNNSLSIVMQKHGEKEKFSIAGSLTCSKEPRRQPRWFYYGPVP